MSSRIFRNKETGELKTQISVLEMGKYCYATCNDCEEYLILGDNTKELVNVCDKCREG